MTVTLTNVINVTVNVTVNVRHTLKIWQNGHFYGQNTKSCFSWLLSVLGRFWMHFWNVCTLTIWRTLLIWTSRWTSGNSGSSHNFRGYFPVIPVLFNSSGLFLVIPVLTVISGILLIFLLCLHVITLVRKSNFQPTQLRHPELHVRRNSVKNQLRIALPAIHLAIGWTWTRGSVERAQGVRNDHISKVLYPF